MSDPVAEVEARVEGIIREHEALWGCDDPVCAVRTSSMFDEVDRPTWWQRVFLRRRR